RRRWPNCLQFQSSLVGGGAPGVGQKAVLDARSVDVTATDKSQPIDPIQRGERCRSGIVEDQQLVWRDKENTVRHSSAIGVSSHDPALVVNPKENRCCRSRRIERGDQRAVPIQIETVADRVAVVIIAYVLVRGVDLVSTAEGLSG